MTVSRWAEGRMGVCGQSRHVKYFCPSLRTGEAAASRCEVFSGLDTCHIRESGTRLRRSPSCLGCQNHQVGRCSAPRYRLLLSLQPLCDLFWQLRSDWNVTPLLLQTTLQVSHWRRVRLGVYKLHLRHFQISWNMCFPHIVTETVWLRTLSHSHKPQCSSCWIRLSHLAKAARADCQTRWVRWYQWSWNVNMKLPPGAGCFRLALRKLGNVRKQLALLL